MKALVSFCAVFFAMGELAAVNAQPVGGCGQVVQSLKNVAATVNQNATAYWAHRAEFGDLIFGVSSATVPNAMQAAEQRKAQGDALRVTMPTALANFKALLVMAQS